MIVEVNGTVEKVDEYEQNDSHTPGFGSCTVRQDLEISGSWKFNSHPNLDAYASYAPNDNLDLLLDKIGFNPDFDYEIDFSELEVKICGFKEEWLEQALNFHDGQYYDNPVKALEIMSRWENSNLNEQMIERIKEDLL